MARTKNPPPPIRPGYSTKILKLDPKGYVFLDGASPESIKAMCSRLAAKHRRKFMTEKSDGGVKVWRIV